MAIWNKEYQRRENGEMVLMQRPVIVSASRSTDIPAFYADWFFHRLKVGYSAWTNPFNGVRMYVSYLNTRFIVFWSKNPQPLLPHIDYLKERRIGCYAQYSLNDYEREGLEKNVPPLQQRIDTFKRLVDALGGIGHVIWRFDPLMLTDNITQDVLLERIQNIGNQLRGYTEKLVFSYADILTYKKVKANLDKDDVHYHEWSDEEMIEFAGKLSKLNKEEGWNYRLATCSERLNRPRKKTTRQKEDTTNSSQSNPKEDKEHILVGKFHIEPNRCIDDELIIRFGYKDEELMKFLKVRIHPMPQPSIFGMAEELPDDAVILPNGTYATHGDNKDTGQREFCGCIMSKDIGQYNTCIHGCEYCYANTSKGRAEECYRQHLLNPLSETITGQ